jgi:hypothetical protein
MQGARRCCGPENVTRQRVCICGLPTSPAFLLIYSRERYFGDLKRDGADHVQGATCGVP